jgi:hypothetical protein
MTYSDYNLERTQIQKGFFEYVLAPWEATQASCLESTAYWITFFVLAILSAGILPMIYQITRCCTEDPRPISRPRLPDLVDPLATPKPVITQINLTSEPKKYDDFSLINLDDFDSPDFDGESTPSVDERLSILEGLRNNQASIMPSKPEKISPLRHLCIRTAAQKVDCLKGRTFTQNSEEVVFLNSAEVYRSGHLNEKDIKNALTIWPTRFLSLYGCTHMTLSESLLVHKQFEFLNFTGCNFSDINKFVESVALQTNLAQLHLGYESLVSQEAFHTLMQGCPNLTSLTLAVDAKDGTLFEKPTEIEYLVLSISTLSEDILRNILTSCPKLKKMTLYFSDKKEEKIDLKKIIEECKPKELENLNIIFDTSTSQIENSYEKMVAGTKICRTEIDTKSLFGFASKANACNFWEASFIFLILRFSHDADKLQMILKQAAQQDPVTPNDLFMFGHLLAEKVSSADLSALCQALEPSPPEANSEQLVSFKINLEIILRAGLEFCCEKIQYRETERAISQLLEKL